MGKNFEIICKGARISWTFRGKPTPSGAQHRNNGIYIKNVTVEDQGHYICHGQDETRKKFYGVSRVSVLSK